MKKMETEEVDEYESCMSSVISDLDELEANLYSYVHHERNTGFDEEYSTVFNVSSFEGICQQNEILVENENIGQSFSNGILKSLGPEEDFHRSGKFNKHGELIDPARFVTSNGSDTSCFVESFVNDAPDQSSSKERKATSGICVQSRDTSPSVLEVSSSEDLNTSERNASKYKMPAASTPITEYVVIGDSDEEVQIEFERVKIKSKKKKKRKKVEIKADIKLNTRSGSEIVCLDVDEDATFSEKENVDSLICGQGYESSEIEKSLCKSWTPQMARFYDESWGGECINVSELQKTMSDDGWKVDISDEFYSLSSKFQNRRYFGFKSKAWCTKCNQKGHYKNECPNKTNQPRCHRCGSSWHQEYSCNQKICLTCGRVRPSLVAVCQQCRKRSWKKCYVCQQPGHPPGCCPDLWRRFHATIVPGEIVTPPKVSYKDSKNIYCCNCASRGHHVFQCKKDNFSDYTPLNPKITSYIEPEALLKFQNTCTRTSTNWESGGAIAPEDQYGDAECYTYLDRGVKRPKNSGNQQIPKHRKLNVNTTSNPASIKIASQECGKKPNKPGKKKERKKSVMFKIKKGVRPEKRSSKQDTCPRPVDSRISSNSKLEKSKSNNASTVNGPPSKNTVNEKEMTGVHSKPGFVERIVVLSPGHLKRIESEEGKEILNYVTSQFKGVTVKVADNPSGVLRLVGAGNCIDQVKVNLFDILNNKYGLDQLKSSKTGSGKSVKNQNKKKYTTVVKSKKKFQNGARQNNQFEMRPKDQPTTAVSNSGDIQMKTGKNRHKIKKKQNAVQRLKYPQKNGKGSKSNNQGKQRYWESELDNDRINHTGVNQSIDSLHSTNIRHLPSIEVRKSNKSKVNYCEISHDEHQANKEVTHPGIGRVRPNHPKAHLSVNRNKFPKRKKNKNGDAVMDKLRVIKLNDGKNGIHSVSSQTKKLRKKISNDLDRFGHIKVEVEVGRKRKVCILDEDNYDHSRISKNQRCSQNSLNMKHLPDQNSLSQTFSSKVS